MESVAGYAARAGCDAPEDAGTMDFASDVIGTETEIQAWTMCDEGLSAELWSIVGGSHIPSLADGATGAILDWLGAYSRCTLARVRSSPSGDVAHVSPLVYLPATSSGAGGARTRRSASAPGLSYGRWAPTARQGTRS